MTRRIALLVLLLSVLPAFSCYAQTMDIPADESGEDESGPEEKNLPPEPSPKLQKQDKAKKDNQQPDEKQVESNVAILQGLNKVMGRVSTFEAPLGTLSNFENLEIIVRKCWKSPPDEHPENAALLEIREVRASEAPRQIFLGWMLSSSPGLSSLEHPVYDITVIACEYKKNIEAN
jgi:hypothetical protein